MQQGSKEEHTVPGDLAALRATQEWGTIASLATTVGRSTISPTSPPWANTCPAICTRVRCRGARGLPHQDPGGRNLHYFRDHGAQGEAILLRVAALHRAALAVGGTRGRGESHARPAQTCSTTTAVAWRRPGRWSARSMPPSVRCWIRWSSADSATTPSSCSPATMVASASRRPSPFIGQKTELLEGGLRVPTLLRWRAALEPQVSDQVSISAWTGCRPYSPRPVPFPVLAYPSDGDDLLPVLQSKERAP